VPKLSRYALGGAFAGIVSLVVLKVGIGAQWALLADEAYYWVWSQNLD
jgi:hypothetical protein